MTSWTERERNSPLIDSDDSVINSVDYYIDTYGSTQWTDRTDGSTQWVAGGLWIENYLPWEATAYPWQRTSLTTTWTTR